MAQHDFKKEALRVHKKLGGKISIVPRASVSTLRDLSLLYTPGVGEVASYIAKHKKQAHLYTIRKRMIAIVSDGSAVLGLGNVGPEAALPVMEGKAVLFKTFADVDAFPLVLATQDTDEIVETVSRIARTFGGINLEDISAPRCFEIESRLKKMLSIPVFHDDQHGTAIVVLAGLINAFKVAKKDIKKATIAIVGAGAAGTAIAKLLLGHKVGNILVLDRKGILESSRKDLVVHKKELAKHTNKKKQKGGIEEALNGADAVVGVSGPDRFGAKHVALMNKNPIVFALANPIPEIMPAEARRGGARIIATGRSDFPNQINNSLVFPGVFRGALDNQVAQITEKMKLSAALALSRTVKKPTEKKFIPGPFEKRVVRAIAAAVR
jgi:malate dehydrogenase (oxaloacetate-decarboxylating)